MINLAFEDKRPRLIDLQNLHKVLRWSCNNVEMMTTSLTTLAVVLILLSLNIVRADQVCICHKVYNKVVLPYQGTIH